MVNVHTFQTAVLELLCMLQEFKDTWSDLNLILDGGRIGTNSGSAESDDDRRGSTVVDLSKEGYYRLIREGT